MALIRKTMSKDILQETYQQAHRARKVKTTYCILCKDHNNKATREREAGSEYTEVGQNITEVCRSRSFGGK